jgi:hypothetical protein
VPRSHYEDNELIDIAIAGQQKKSTVCGSGSYRAIGSVSGVRIYFEFCTAKLALKKFYEDFSSIEEFDIFYGLLEASLGALKSFSEAKNN